VAFVAFFGLWHFHSRRATGWKRWYFDRILRFALGTALFYLLKAMSSRSPYRLSKSDYERLAALRYQLRRFLHFSEVEAEAVGLTPRQYQGLLAVAGYPGRDAITIGELAKQLLVAHHSAVGLVDRLSAQGLVERQPGPQDRRQVFVRLTPHGNALLEKLAHAHRAELLKLSPKISTLLQTLNHANPASDSGK
jgi:DNA-binding MarR family transcriptional regulator